MIDLREHFGIWDRCGNTRFFKKQNSWSEIYLNPIDGVLISARRETFEGPPRYTLVVREADKAGRGEVRKAYDANQPWVEKVVDRFFYYKALGWAIDALKDFSGKPPMPGDRDMGNFLTFYKSGGERYRREGSATDVEPMLEETLEGILRIMNSMERITVDYARNLSQEDLDEALAEHGILECA